MTFDAARGRCVLFGGFSEGIELAPPDVWEWDGVNWTQVPAPPGPSARYDHGAAFDARRNRVVLFGGKDSVGTLLTDTWEWDGARWQERPAPPASISDVAMAFDAASGRIVLVGSRQVERAPNDFCYYFEHWEYAVPCDTIGSGHAGGGLALTCSARPRVGAPLCLSFPSAQGSALFLVGLSPPMNPPLAVDPPALCARGFVWTAPWYVLPLAGNPASFCVDIPDAPGVAGVSVCLQGAAVEAGGCYRLTDAVVVTVQRD